MVALTLPLRRLKFVSVCLAFLFALFIPAAAGTSAGEILYLQMQSNSPLPQFPTSLLVQSPTYIQVDAGATLSVYLLRGETMVATSTLTFDQAFGSERLIPSVPVASFVPPGSSTGPGQPLPGATLRSGETDLSRVAIDPSRYKLLWVLSSGVMGTPGRAVVTGSEVAFIDLKLAAVSASTIAGDQKPGSVLFFNRYSSSAANPRFEDTKLNITNTSPTSSVYIRLFLINAATCEPTSYSFCLAAQQTESFRMSDIDPGVKGYAVAIATNAQGEPVSFNWLIGNVAIKQAAANINGTVSAVLSALAIARIKDSVVENTGGFAEMIFDDVNYERLPGQIAFDSVPSQFNGANSTIVSFYRPLSNLSGAISSVGVQLTAWGKNEQNQVVTSAGSVSVACYSDFAVSALRLSPSSVAQLIPPGSTAWMSAGTTDIQPLLGSQINSGEFNGGNNARPLSLVTDYRIRIPVTPVSCQTASGVENNELGGSEREKREIN